MPDQTPITPADTITPWYEDKAFLGVIIHLVAVAALALAHVQLNEAGIVAIASTLITFIVAHKAKSGAALIALIKAQAAQTFIAQTPATPATLPQIAAALDKPVQG